MQLRPVITAALLFLSFPLFAFAGSYTPIVGIPGVSGDDFEAYMNSIYALSITVAALLAVIKIVIAGVKWMVTDVVTTKGEAKKDIQGALLGLLVILSAVLILSVINTDIVGGNITDNQTQQTPGTVSTGSTAPTLSITPTTAVDGSTPVYESIPANASSQNRAAFIASCTSPRTAVQQVVTGDVRCYNTSAGQSVAYSTICASAPCPSNLQTGDRIECEGSSTLGLSGRGSGGTGSQTYYVDPLDASNSVCFYTP